MNNGITVLHINSDHFCEDGKMTHLNRFQYFMRPIKWWIEWQYESHSWKTNNHWTNKSKNWFVEFRPNNSITGCLNFSTNLFQWSYTTDGFGDLDTEVANNNSSFRIPLLGSPVGPLKWLVNLYISTSFQIDKIPGKSQKVKSYIPLHIEPQVQKIPSY